MPEPALYDYANQLRNSEDFFTRSTNVLEEADSSFHPQPGMMTVAQQVGHVAQTIHWFLEGATQPEGFNLDFAAHAKELAGVTSLTTARGLLKDAYARAVEFARSRSAEELAKPLPQGPVMGGAPTSEIFLAMIEHAAHHRGALTVYSRQLGKVPAMPYGG